MRVVCALLFIATACATTPTPSPTGPPGTIAANGSNAGSDSMVCHEVEDTGSLFSHTECVPKDQEAARRENDTMWMKHPTSQPSSAQGGQIGGGPIHN